MADDFGLFQLHDSKGEPQRGDGKRLMVGLVESDTLAEQKDAPAPLSFAEFAANLSTLSKRQVQEAVTHFLGPLRTVFERLTKRVLPGHCSKNFAMLGSLKGCDAQSLHTDAALRRCKDAAREPENVALQPYSVLAPLVSDATLRISPKTHLQSARWGRDAPPSTRVAKLTELVVRPGRFVIFHGLAAHGGGEYRHGASAR